jgi:hypothetical protein
VDRAARVLAAINELASAEGVPVAVRHVCVACAAALDASGVVLYVVGELGLCEPLYVTSAVSELVAELQPGPLAFTQPARRTAQAIDLQESRDNFRCQPA